MMNSKKASVAMIEKEGQINTTNYPMDGHKEFCRRCLRYNDGGCPENNGGSPKKSCTL